MSRPPKNNGNPQKTADIVDPSSPYCVVLGAGGARGFAHLGAMQALGERQIPVSRIVGASMGALMAGVIAVERDSTQARDRVIDYLRSPNGRKLQSTAFPTGEGSKHSGGRRWGVRLLSELKKRTALVRAVRSQSLLPSTVLRDAIEALIPDVDIRDLLTPLQIVTVDLCTGQRIVLDSGSLRRAIRASMSIPGIFPAVCNGALRLGDIGVYDSVPCDVPADERVVIGGSEGIIAVDVGQQVEDRAKGTSALDAAFRLQAFAEQTIRQQSLAKADVVIRPNIQSTQWFDFSEPETIIQEGYQAAADVLGIVRGIPQHPLRPECP